MSGNQKSLINLCTGIALGITMGRILDFREMWRLRARADEHQYMAELLMYLHENRLNLSDLLNNVPGKHFFLAGRKKYVCWLKDQAADPRFCDDPVEADAIVTLTPGESGWEKPTFWIRSLIRERKQ